MIKGEDVGLVEKGLGGVYFYGEKRGGDKGIDGVYGEKRANGVGGFEVMKGVRSDGV